MRICVFGDALLDVYEEVNPVGLSPEATTLICDKGDSFYILGGAAHTAFQCVRTGNEVELISVVGNDLYGRQLYNLIDSHGINTKNVVIQKSDTLHKKRIVDRNGMQLIRIDMSEIGILAESKEDILASIKQCAENCDVLMITDMNEGISREGLTEVAINEFNAKGKFVVVNGRPANVNSYYNADVVVMNVKEASEAVGKMEPIDLARYLARKTKTSTLVTGDKRGMWYYNKKFWAVTYIPSYPIPDTVLIDPVGAGDILCATIAAEGKISAPIIKHAAKRTSENIQGVRYKNPIYNIER